MTRCAVFVAFCLILPSCSSLQEAQTQNRQKIEIIDAKIDKISQNKDSLKDQGYLETLIEKSENDQYLKKHLINDLFIKASDASFKEDGEMASKILKALIRLDPKNIYLKKRLAYEYIRGGRPKRAQELLIEVFELSNGQDEKISLALAGISLAIGDIEKAKKTYRHIIKHKAHVNACIFLTKIYMSEKDDRKAYNVLNRCEKNIKGHGGFSYLKGKLALAKGREQLALKHFKDSLKKQPNYHLSVVALGILYERKGKRNSALKEYEKYLKADPDNMPILSKVIHTLLFQKNYKKSFPYIERLSGLDPNNLNLKMQLGLIYSETHRFKEAIGVFEEILTTIPDSDQILYSLGTLYEKISKPENAISKLKKINEKSPLYLKSLLLRAHILSTMAQEGITTKEEDLLQLTKVCMEKYQDIRVEMGIILADFYEYKEDIQKAIQILVSIEQEKMFKEEHQYYLASLFEQNHNFNASNKIMRMLLSKNPNDYQALNFLGYSLLEQNNELEQAYGHIKKAVKLKPNNGYILDSLGWYYYKIGNYKKALKELKKAWSLIKNDATINKHLAIVHEKLKSYKKAKYFYIKALVNCKVLSEKKEVLKALRQLQWRLSASTP